MSNLVGFSRPDAKRIADVVRHVEGAPLRGVPRTSQRKVRSEPAPPGVFLAKVVSSGFTNDIYVRVDIYGNGVDKPPTRTNVSVLALNLAFNSSVPAGTWMFVTRSMIGGIGSGPIAE